MKLTIFSLAVIATIGFSSCAKKRDYTCTCTVTPTGGTSSQIEKAYTNTTQSEALDQCTAYGKSAVGGNGTYKCSVK